MQIQLDDGTPARSSAAIGDPFERGRRVFETDGLEAGRHDLEVTLLSAGRPVVGRSYAIRLERSLVVLAVLTRDCRGVACPGGGDSVSATECFEGTCVRSTLCADAEMCCSGTSAASCSEVPCAGQPALLSETLSAWCERCPRRVVLLLDEIDAVRGQSLISVLRQLRAGFPKRPDHAPWSVMLCGLRDVRDYKLASGGAAERLGTSSPFNVKLESLTLGTFSDAEVRALLLQHTTTTGQAFDDAATMRLTELAGGQPWLVNALACEIVSKLRITGPIERAHVETAKERLILARATHLDAAFDRGFITLDDDGCMVLADSLDAGARAALGLAGSLPAVSLTDTHRAHRDPSTTP